MAGGRKSRNEWWEIGNKTMSVKYSVRKKMDVHCLIVLKSQV